MAIATHSVKMNRKPTHVATRSISTPRRHIDAGAIIQFGVDIYRTADTMKPSVTGSFARRAVESFYSTLDDNERASVDVMVLDNAGDAVFRRLLIRRATWAKRFAEHVSMCADGLVIGRLD